MGSTIDRSYLFEFLRVKLYLSVLSLSYPRTFRSHIRSDTFVVREKKLSFKHLTLLITLGNSAEGAQAASGGFARGSAEKLDLIKRLRGLLFLRDMN